LVWRPPSLRGTADGTATSSTRQINRLRGIPRWTSTTPEIPPTLGIKRREVSSFAKRQVERSTRGTCALRSRSTVRAGAWRCLPIQPSDAPPKRSERRTIFYDDPTKPHQPSRLVTAGVAQAITHDVNGNRARKDKDKARYKFDRANRLTKVKTRGHTARFTYDYTGRRVTKKDTTRGYATQTTRYFSDYWELGTSFQLRRYFVGDMYVASEQTSIPTGAFEEAGLLGDSVRVAADVQGGSPVLRLVLDDEAGTACLAVMTLLMAGMLVRSPRRRRLGAVAVRVGPSLTLIVAVSVGTLPWAIVLTPRAAEAQTASSTVLHYHHDHIGSTQLVTRSAGTVDMQIRYDAWGQVRGRFDAADTQITLPERHNATRGPRAGSGPVVLDAHRQIHVHVHAWQRRRSQSISMLMRSSAAPGYALTSPSLR
jgi:YD repeat-containing protein